MRHSTRRDEGSRGWKVRLRNGEAVVSTQSTCSLLSRAVNSTAMGITALESNEQRVFTDGKAPCRQRHRATA